MGKIRVNGTGRTRVQELTKPQSCCSPCSKQAIVKALRFPGTPNISDQMSLMPDKQEASSFPRMRPRFACSSSRTSHSISLIIIGAMFFASRPDPYTFSRTPVASSGLPTLTSHLGLSGITSMTKHCTPAGSAPNPTIHRQPSCPPRSAKPHPIKYATTCPSVTKSTFNVTNRPRNFAGASSAIYSGTTKLAAPTASPTIDRPTTITHTVNEKA